MSEFMDIPYVAIGNDEIDAAAPLGEDGAITCKRCGERHIVEYGDTVAEDGTKTPSRTIGFMQCQGKTYLATIAGKVVF